MTRIGRLVIAILLVILMLPSARAEGIAIVQAPEQSFGICKGPTAKEAFACARKQCVKGGAAPDDCLEMAYCAYGWTVDVFMQSKEGNHWHEYHCGWKTHKEAEAAGKLACNKQRMLELMECSVVQIYDPTAKPQIKD
ncbi:hypothetical protein JJB09_22625 [Rhizobium sp. KVB221]|uniref:DUF4189 domain-containing protein n=1 Tax=Rhizobium setariae TaxID=2801340 RepID=A0A937CRL4_9HYPH|nr:hypothetical protein [Rhizobium setariae]MBL0374812.1 hypothetical protein [Rhizobium setariae]